MPLMSWAARMLQWLVQTAAIPQGGANRLASNSLLECVVLGRAAALHIAQQSPTMGLICASATRI